MSIKAMNWAWDQKLPPNSKLILMAIADAADEEGDCWPKVKTIAKKCGVSERTVQRVLKDFISNSFLTVTPRFSHEGRQVSNNYRLTYLNTYPDDLSPSLVSQNREGEGAVTPRASRRCQGEGDSVVADLEPPHESTREPVGGIHTSLVLPKSLTEAQSRVIIEMLDGRPHAYSKALLEDLADAMDRQTIKTTPQQWFRGMLRRRDKSTSRSIRGDHSTNCNIKTEQDYREKLIQAGVSLEDAALIASKTYQSRSNY